jgi:hypothetical protein
MPYGNEERVGLEEGDNGVRFRKILERIQSKV